LHTCDSRQIDELAVRPEPQIQHLQYPATSHSRKDADNVFDLSFYVEDSPYLRSLCLPSALSRSHPDRPGLDRGRDQLLEACRVRNVDIIWRPYANKPEDDFGISKEFWGYAKEVKRKNREQTEAEGGRASGSV
jgi:hypothetical protein